MGSRYYQDEYEYNEMYSHNKPNFDQRNSENYFSNECNDNFDYADEYNNSLNHLEDLKRNLSILKQTNQRIIMNSEKNIFNETKLITEQKNKNILSKINEYRLNDIKSESDKLEMSFSTMEKIINAVIQSCTKDNIAAAKNWIIEQSNKGSLVVNNILEYMMFLVTTSTVFAEKLHIIYLTNDLLHYCKRKNCDVILYSIERCVLSIFLSCANNIDDDQRSKLNKVLSLWESNSYLNSDIIHSLKTLQNDPQDYLSTIFNEDIRRFKEKEDFGIIKIDSLSGSITHFQSDARMHMQILESNHNQLKHDLKLKEESLEVEIYNMERSSDDMLERQKHQSFPSNIPSGQFEMPDITQPPPGFVQPPIHPTNSEIFDDYNSRFDSHMQLHAMPQVPQVTLHNMPPPFNNEGRQNNPTIPQDLPDESLKSLPYWRLPSAVMLVQIKLGDFDYKPIDSESIELPQLKNPSQKLLESVRQFYSPTTETCRDSDGWEIGKLEEFFKLKKKAKNGEVPDDLLRDIHNNMSISNNGFTNDGKDSDERGSMMRPLRGMHHSDVMGHNTPSLQTGAGASGRSLLGNPWDQHHTNSNNASYNMVTRVTPLMSLEFGENRSRNPPNNNRRFNNSYNNRPNRSRSYGSGASSRSYSRSRSRTRSKSRSRSSSYSSILSNERRRRVDRSVSRSRSESKSTKNGKDNNSPRKRSVSKSSSATKSSRRSFSQGFKERYSRSYSRSRSGSPTNKSPSIAD